MEGGEETSQSRSILWNDLARSDMPTVHEKSRRKYLRLQFIINVNFSFYTPFSVVKRLFILSFLSIKLLNASPFKQTNRNAL